MRGRLGVAALVVVSLGGALLLAELVLRVAIPAAEGYFVYPPGLEREFEPRHDLMPGVRGTSHFVVNSMGLRGDELEPGHTRRILAVGGSTTQCLYLDQTEAWPHVLQELLAAPGPGSVWVGNAGKAGRTLPEYFVQLEHLLPQIPDLDTVLVLVGANDVNRRLNAGEGFRAVQLRDADVRESLLPRAFDVYPRRHALLPPRRMAVWSLLEGAWRGFEIRRHWEMIQDRAGRNYEVWRQRRREASEIREQLPDLGPALDAYRDHLRAVQTLAQRHGVRAIFLTQPYVYRDDLPEEVERLLWMGWIGRRQTDRNQPYYSVGALADAYAAYNGELLRFCREDGAECLDLEPRIPKDTRSFYDDIHFNEPGSERVARVVFAHLSEGPPS